MSRQWLCFLTVAVLGCQSAPPGRPIARFSSLDNDAALTILARRAEMIRAMTGQCELTLKRSGQQVVRLDGLMVMAPPDRVRLRVWKMDQAVFDLTVLPDGVWIERAPQEADGPVVPATVSAVKMSRELCWFIGGFFRSPGLAAQPSPKGDLLYRRYDPDGTSIECQVDAATATARRFNFRDALGNTRFSLDMSDYGEVDGIAWPMRLAAWDAADHGEIDVAFSRVEFNGELAPRAFIPPPGAEKQP